MVQDPFPEPRPALKDLMASVGYLLLFWGHVERRLDGQPVPEALQPVRRLRNDLCHTLEAARSFPLEDREPELTCRRPGGERVIYNWTQMDDAIRALEAFAARA